MPKKMDLGAGAGFCGFLFEIPHLPLPAEESTTGAGAKMSLSLDVFPPGPEAGDEDASDGSGGLAFATTKQVPTLKETDLSRAVEEVSNNMSGQGESEQVKILRDDYEEKLHEEYERFSDEQTKNERLKERIAKANADLVTFQRERENIEYELQQCTLSLTEEQGKIHSLEARNARVDRELAQSEAALTDARRQNENLQVDYQQLEQALKDSFSVRDNALLDCKDAQLQFEELEKQWHEAKAEIEEMKETLKEHIDFEEKNDLQGDIAEANAEHERTLRLLDVKDERISHLEALLQKEIERNRHEADEKARAAAASPVDDDRHIGSLGGSLEAELSLVDDSEWFAPEPSDYEPAFVPLSTSPIHVAASVGPRNPTPAPLSTSPVRQAASTEPEAAKSPIQTIELREAASSPPVEPSRAALSFYNAPDVFSYAPEQPAHETLVLSGQKTVNTEPIEPARASVSFHDVRSIANYPPEEPARAPLTTYEQEVANSPPLSPEPVVSALVSHEIANIAPREPSVPVLRFSATEAISTSPIARQNSTAELSTQTDVPAMATDLSTQTDVPAFTSQLVPHAALETIPIEPDTQTAVVKPINRIAPVMVTRDIKPVEQVLHMLEPKRMTAISSKKSGFMDWISTLFTIFLVFYTLVLQAELAAWKNANGVGFGGGYGNVASRSGAYGNGRHLFGVIPVGMHIGNSWVSEQIARRFSVAISLIEDLTGITNQPHY